ncbi:MAG: 50S ribosomal protein L3, partial [Candidatus Falkowbacteria bacterium]|nr:50S ribosomal protein L3 [Candidatus Falkowbacteria bacterium]
MKFILGKKLNMTQIWENDRVIAVTPILAGPCAVAQIKTTEKDGYQALQLAWGEKKLKNIKKPQIGHLKKINSQARFLREFRIKEAPTCNLGDVVTVGTFVLGDIVDAIGTSKGKGFQGVVKRHGFHGGPKTHGQKNRLRAPGSIGTTALQRVRPGRRMAGRMGQE